MKQITVISGKGGTGKTTVTAALAFLSKGKAVLADADVDAPDLHLILQPKIQSKEELFVSKKATRDEDKCTRCGICERECRYGAITTTEINLFKCEGCGLCTHLCPENALTLEKVFSANLFESKTRFAPFVHVEMAIGEGGSGHIVTAVRKKAQEITEEKKLDYLILDGSPGIGCPVIASITGIDLALIVVEPTLSGIHDLERVIGITKHFDVKAAVCINKFDLNQENTEGITKYCKENDVPVVGQIPFDEVVPKSIIQQKSVCELPANTVTKEITKLWKKVEMILNAEKRTTQS